MAVARIEITQYMNRVWREMPGKFQYEGSDLFLYECFLEPTMHEASFAFRTDDGKTLTMGERAAYGKIDGFGQYWNRVLEMHNKPSLHYPQYQAAPVGAVETPSGDPLFGSW